MKIIYNPVFENELLHIVVNHIAEDKPNASIKFALELEKSILDIPIFPFKYKPSSYFSDKNVRDMTYKRYTVVYEVNLDENLGMVLTIGENDELDEGDYLRITDVQFEKGSVTTEFEVLPYEMQLDRCLRYYEETGYEIQDMNGSSFYNSTKLSEIKRIIPNIIIISYNGTLGKITNIHDNTEADASIFDSNKDIITVFCENDDSDNEKLGYKIQADAELPGRGE